MRRSLVAVAAITFGLVSSLSVSKKAHKVVEEANAVFPEAGKHSPLTYEHDLFELENPDDLEEVKKAEKKNSGVIDSLISKPGSGAFLDDPSLPRPEWGWKDRLGMDELQIGDVLFSFHAGQYYIKLPEQLASKMNNIRYMLDWNLDGARCRHYCSSKGDPVTHAAVVIQVEPEIVLLEGRGKGMLKTKLKDWMVGQIFYSVMRLPNMDHRCPNHEIKTAEFIKKVGNDYEYSRKNAIVNFLPDSLRNRLAYRKYKKFKGTDSFLDFIRDKRINSRTDLPKVYFCSKFIAWYFFYLGCAGFKEDTDLDMWPKQLRCHMCHNNFVEVDKCLGADCGCDWCQVTERTSIFNPLDEDKQGGHSSEISSRPSSMDDILYNFVPNKNSAWSSGTVPRSSIITFGTQAAVNGIAFTPVVNQTYYAAVEGSRSDESHESAYIQDGDSGGKGRSINLFAPGGRMGYLALSFGALWAMLGSWRSMRSLYWHEVTRHHLEDGRVRSFQEKRKLIISKMWKQLGLNFQPTNYMNVVDRQRRLTALRSDESPDNKVFEKEIPYLNVPEGSLDPKLKQTTEEDMKDSAVEETIAEVKSEAKKKRKEE